MLRFILCALSLSAFASNNFLLSEKSLIENLKDSPSLETIEAALLNSKLSYQQASDPYSYTLTGSASHQRSGEIGINQFSPVTERLTAYKIGVNRPLSNGIALGVDAVTSKTTNNFVRNLGGTNIIGKISIDLYKNFLGRSSLANLRTAELGYEAAKIQKKIDIKNLEMNLRKTFWNYVAAKESKDLAQTLLKSAKKQLSLARRQRRSDVADSGDVARFASQVSSRESQILSYDATMKQLEVSLKNTFPKLAYKDFKLAPYSKKKTLEKFYQCLNVISAEKQTPEKFTYYDELIKMKKKQYEKRKKSISAYSDMDIKLEGQVGFIGNGVGFEASRRGLTSDHYDTHSIALNVSMPIDGKKKETQKAQLALAKAQLDAETSGLEAQLASYHVGVVQNIKLIIGIIESRGKNSGYLKRALNDARKKYRQARYSSQQLLQEEDSYSSNEIQLITTQKEVLLLMFDYFSLFQETPCGLNKV